MLKWENDKMVMSTVEPYHFTLAGETKNCSIQREFKIADSK